MPCNNLPDCFKDKSLDQLIRMAIRISADGCTYIATSDTGSGNQVNIEQVGHGFVLPAHGFIPVYSNAGTITAADASAASTVHTLFIVAIPDADTLTITIGGIKEISGHGLTPGTAYYTSDTVAGDIVTVEPAISDLVAKPIDGNFIALYNTPAFII